jgi:hypothetical protein
MENAGLFVGMGVFWDHGPRFDPIVLDAHSIPHGELSEVDTGNRLDRRPGFRFDGFHRRGAGRDGHGSLAVVRAQFGSIYPSSQTTE